MERIERLYYQQIGMQLKQARKEKGWSLADLSERLTSTKARSTLKRYEDGGRVKMPVMTELCNALGIDPYVVMQKAEEEVFAIMGYTPEELARMNPEFRAKKAQEMRGSEDEEKDRIYDLFQKMNEEHQKLILEMIEMYSKKDAIS